MPILEVENLRKEFRERRWIGRADVVYAVNRISFSIGQGEVFGLVGESGCGKSTAARCILRLEKPTGGDIRFLGREIGHLGERHIRPLRKCMQIVFQDPTDSLNPRFTVRRTLTEPLMLQGDLSKRDQRDRILEILEVVGLLEEHLPRYPHQLSTGQQQRVGIARAVISTPKLVVLDEPTAALDISVKGRDLEMLLDLKARFGLTYLFISHDLSTIRHLCDRVAVMYLGFIVEQGPANEVFEMPLHPYPKALVSCLPTITPATRKRRILLQGEVPSPIELPVGCPFFSRCSQRMPICESERPQLSRIPSCSADSERFVSCHLFRSEESAQSSTSKHPDLPLHGGYGPDAVKHESMEGSPYPNQERHRTL